MGTRRGGIESVTVSFGSSDEPSSRETSPAPVTFLVVSELGARSPAATHPSPAHARLSLDRVSFDTVFEHLAPSLAIEVPDPFCPEEPPLRVDIRLTSLRSLRPDALVEQSPVLRSLREVVRLRQQPVRLSEQESQLARVAYRPSWVPRLLGGIGTSGSLLPSVPATPSPPAALPPPVSPPTDTGPSEAPSLASILSQVTWPTPPAAPAPEPLGQARTRTSHLVSAIVADSRSGPPPTVAWSPPLAVEAAFQQVLGAVLAHPEFRRLERAWRGLKLLTDAIEPRRGVRLAVVPMVEGALVSTLAALARDTSAPPIDLLVVDQAIPLEAHALDELAACATHARATHTPILLEATPALLGADTLGALDHGASARTTADSALRNRLDALATEDGASWVALVANGPLARVPYTSASSRLRDVPFEEGEAAPLYLHAVHVVAALAARSAARHGWPSDIEGPEAGVFPGLPVLEHQGMTVAAFPLASLLSTDAVRTAADAGVATLTCLPNRDVAILTTAPTLARRAHPDGSPSLGDQLFAGRLGRWLARVVNSLGSGASSADVEDAMQTVLGDAFHHAPSPGPEVAVSVSSDQVMVTVWPRRLLGVRVPEVHIALRRPH